VTGKGERVLHPVRARFIKNRIPNMSEIIDQAVKTISAKVGGTYDGSAKFVITGEGAVIMDDAGVRAGTDDDETEVTLIASAETFQGILEGDVNPTMAYMSGKLKIDGSMTAAMKLASVLG
jgi:putative sterol carrier protein